MRFLAVAAFAVLFSVGAAQAQQNCGPSDTLAEHLANNYGERLIYIAAMADGQTLALFVNDQTQSWTMAIMNGPIACLVASGTGVNMVPTGLAL